MLRLCPEIMRRCPEIMRQNPTLNFLSRNCETLSRNCVILSRNYETSSHKNRPFKNADRRSRHRPSPVKDAQIDIIASKTSQTADRIIETCRLDVLTPGHRRDTKCSENDIEWGDVDHSVSCSARLANSLEVFDIIWRDNTLLSRHLHVDQVCLHKHQAVKTAIGTLGTQPFIGSFINCRPESIVTIGQEIAVDFVLGKLSVLIILITVTSLLTINL